MTPDQENAEVEHMEEHRWWVQVLKEVHGKKFLMLLVVNGVAWFL
jgi:hypothetical protein